jgi:spore coat polysaccharide biosynthesis protein SpsF
VNEATVIIQARMGSTRLPGKSLMALGSHTVIDWVSTRAAMADSIVKVVVATSSDPGDDVLADHLRRRGTTVVRGHPTDVLDRYVTALAEAETDIIVRVTGDCPFVQPELIDQAVDSITGIDYVPTDADGRFPRGFDVEAVRRGALLAAHAEATDPLEREHVTPFIVRRPERFTTIPLACPAWAQHPELRITVDERPDLELLRRVVRELDASPESLTGRDVIELLLDRPDIAAINANVNHNIVR